MIDTIFEDYFGHKTEEGFLDWAVDAFRKEDIKVVDKSAMTYLFKKDGDPDDESCEPDCERCWEQWVWVTVKYEDNVLNFSGFYFKENGNLVLSSSGLVPA